MVKTDKHILFWSDWPSNFAWSPIIIDCNENGIKKFFSVEQFYQWSKAKFFNDTVTMVAIEELDFYEADSAETKRLGRKTENFNAVEWNKVSYEIMKKGVLAKFSQNKVLFDKITDPSLIGKKFVEASPYDPIWGIKMGENDPLADDESNWRGENRLGKVLDDVRVELLNGYKDEIKY